ncbi:MAG: outer membrane beta-barrel protein [Burkholderiales bacterium]|nr:outer membrane beta-barrel protein [Opitutaceae bacterium]
MSSKLLLPLVLAATLLPSASHAAEPEAWTFEVSLYGLAAGMSGDVVVKGVPADVDLGFDQILDNLELGAMGKIRVGHGQWALTADIIYMELGASKNGVSVDFEQWVVEPSLSYRFNPNLEVLAGARYNRLDASITGPFSIDPSSTESWWDPIVGANVSLPLGEKFSFNMRGDIGGFNVGSDLTWQAFPSVSWQFANAWSLNAGYRWVYTDYSNGSGTDEFKYDILTQGPQLGVTYQF